MNFIKAFFSWKLWLNIILGIAILVGLWKYVFRWLEDYTLYNVEVEVPDLSTMNIKEAMAQLDELGLTYNVDSIHFTKDKKPYEVLEFFPAAGAKVKPGRRVFIKSNPKTWQPVALPNLIDKSKRLAFTKLGMRHFVVGDTIYEKDPAKDAVLRVLYEGEPVAPETLLPRGAKVDLVLGRGYDYDMPVPNLVGLDLLSATKLIEENYFELGDVHYFDQDNDTVQATVVYQDPPSTDVYDQGLPISIWLSTRTNSELRKEIDSLDIAFRRKITKDDSLYIKSIEKSKKIRISDLPEEVRNQVKYDEVTAPKKKQKSKKAPTAPVDTTGITIE